jgi:hypothetical protein
MAQKNDSTRYIIKIVIVLATSFLLLACGNSSEPTNVEPIKAEPTKADSSSYNQDIRKATTSKNLSKADLAWHAQNTYGWDCAEVISKGKMLPDGYFYIECANGTKLRVYLREGQHPRITNANGGYE